jgi:hypothetical protein
MIPLSADAWYRFRFAEPRRVSRFHLDGVGEGQLVAIHRLDPDEETPGGELCRARVGPRGWVDLDEPLLVRPGRGFAVRGIPDD